ncbi:MAG: hypothetical protein A3I89_03455 [Candidatus Harrisonbacteria bacterium RIFCSPLOWO2_02_FULL_41_11]|nr:MAG: hypothetical protein A3I89_03455 [Candidatus Harrisonbacteria bacterium RIFCSPLOWO2_02_FULL_41_11]
MVTVGFSCSNFSVFSVSVGIILGVATEGNGGGGSGLYGFGEGIFSVNSGSANGFGDGLAPPVCFRASISDFIVRTVISGGGGGNGGEDSIGKFAGGSGGCHFLLGSSINLL